MAACDGSEKQSPQVCVSVKMKVKGHPAGRLLYELKNQIKPPQSSTHHSVVTSDLSILPEARLYKSLAQISCPLQGECPFFLAL